MLPNAFAIAGFMLISTGMLLVIIALVFVLCKAVGRLAQQVHHLHVMVTSLTNLQSVVRTTHWGSGSSRGYPGPMTVVGGGVERPDGKGGGNAA